MNPVSERPLQIGDSAPEFALPAVHYAGTVSLSDYRGKNPVLVGLFRGLHCPFCRRQLARFAQMRDKLEREGVETLAIVNTTAERARQYFQYRPTRLASAADPEAGVHHAFGLHPVAIVPDNTDPRELHWPQCATVAQLSMTSFNPDGDLPQGLNLLAASDVLNAKDRFELTEVDKHTAATNLTQLEGQFLIDPAGTIRWTFIEAPDHAEQFGSVPSDDEVLTAARTVTR